MGMRVTVAALWLMIACALAFPNARSGPSQPTPADKLHEAVHAGRLDDVKHLIDSGVSVDARNALGSTPLHEAAWSGNAEIAAFLIERGADVNARHSEAGSTPLHYAILTSHSDVVELLLNAGADPLAPYRGGQLALHLAAARGNARIVQALLAK